MNKPIVSAFGAAVGLVCALFVLWLWRNDMDMRAKYPPPTVRLQPAPATSTTSYAATRHPALALNPAAQLLVAKLGRMLARPDVRANEAVLTFKDAAAMERFLNRARKAGLTILGQIDAMHAVRVGFRDLQALESELGQNPGDYSDLSANYVFSVPQVPAKQDRAAITEVPFGNTALDYIGATGNRSQWGHGVTIAVLDTGVMGDPTFGSGRVSTLDIGLGTAPGTASSDGHGTSVASLAAGMSPDAAGVAPAANILSIRVTDASGSSDIFTLSQGIIAAVDAGAKVINISLGGYATNNTLENAITYAIGNGAVIVAAAGNDQAAQLAWPAADPRVISVGAVDRAGQQVTFSNSGPELQLTAPGYGIQTAWLNGQRAYVDGTSASAPLVSGSIAALMSQDPALTASAAAQLLDKTASDAGVPGADPAYGNGILNVGWAMNVNNPTYVDTAVASHYFDAAANQMDFTVQNRSGQAIAGMTLNVIAGDTSSSYMIGNLAPGQTQVIKVPVDAAQLAAMGQIRYTTTLINPLGVNDQVPANNRQTSVLTAPPKAK